MSDTESKVKIKVDVDMDQAVREFERLKRAQEQQAAQTKLVGNKFEELGKSMVGLQMHAAFDKLSKSVGTATDGMIDLNAAFAGYQVAGLWGAAIGGLSGALVKLADVAGVGAGAMSVAKDAMAEYEKGTKNVLDPVEGLMQSQRRLAAQYQGELMDGFRAGVKSAKDYEASIKDVLKVSSALVADIGRINAASGVMSDTDRAILAIQGKQKGPGRAFLGGTVGGITGKQGKASGGKGSPGDVSDYIGGVGSERMGIGEDVGAIGGRGIFDTGGMAKATQGLDEFGNKQAEVAAGAELLAANTSAWMAELAAHRASSDSFMESTFGKLGEIDAYKSAFDGLTAGVTAGYDAMVDGTMSFGAAFKKSIAESLKAFGGKMLVEALAETAYGIRDLATYNYGGAALHFKSAAGFGVAAVAAGVVAHGMGTGGGGSGTGASGGAGGAGAPYVGGSGSSSGDSGKHITIVYGDGFANDSPRNRQARVDRDIRKSLGSSGVGNN